MEDGTRLGRAGSDLDRPDPPLFHQLVQGHLQRRYWSIPLATTVYAGDRINMSGERSKTSVYFQAFLPVGPGRRLRNRRRVPERSTLVDPADDGLDLLVSQGYVRS